MCISNYNNDFTISSNCSNLNKNTFSKVPTFFGNAPESWGRSWELDKHEPFSRALFTPPHTQEDQWTGDTRPVWTASG